MKNVLLIGIWCFCAFGSWSQRADSLNRVDAQGRKQGYWIYYGKQRPESGIESDGKVEEGSFFNDEKNGEWIKYHPDGKTPKLVGTYKNNHPTGDYRKFYSTGKLKEKGTYLHNQYADSLRRYHENGKLEYEAWYNQNGKEEGTVNYYHSNGHLEFTYTAKNGIQQGIAYRYYATGDIKEVIHYSENGSVKKSETFPEQQVTGKSVRRAPDPGNKPNTKSAKWQPNGYNKVYNGRDEIWLDGTFRDGKLWEGKSYIYDTDGILIKVEIYKYGIFHADGQI